MEYPTIKTDDDKLTIEIPLDALVKIIEARIDAKYKVEKPEKLLDAVKFELENYAGSNAVECGLSELQYLLDEITDKVYLDAEDIIIELNHEEL